MNNKVNYKTALSKQIWTIVIVLGILITYTISIDLKSDLQFYIWLIMFISTSYIIFILLKKQSKEALCPFCQADLFEVIQSANGTKLDFNFCPTCGEKIDI